MHNSNKKYYDECDIRNNNMYKDIIILLLPSPGGVTRILVTKQFAYFKCCFFISTKQQSLK